MNIETVSEAPRPYSRLPYQRLAEEYNALPVGEVLRFARVTNITNFKHALTRRGLVDGSDYLAYQKGRHCFVKRLSETPIAE